MSVKREFTLGKVSTDQWFVGEIIVDGTLITFRIDGVDAFAVTVRRPWNAVAYPCTYFQGPLFGTRRSKSRNCHTRRLDNVVGRGTVLANPPSTICRDCTAPLKP